MTEDKRALLEERGTRANEWGMGCGQTGEGAREVKYMNYILEKCMYVWYEWKIRGGD